MVQEKTKQCKKCQEYKTIEHYRISKEGYWYSYCRLCVNAISREKHEKTKDKRNAQIKARYWRLRPERLFIKDKQRLDKVKTCVECKEEKPYSEFYTEKNQRISSRCKICAKVHLKRWKKNNKERMKECINKYKIRQPISYLLIRCRIRAKKKNLEYNLSREDIVIPKFCPVLGIKITFGQEKYNSPSIDRIDNNKGYIKGNIIVVSVKANELKRDSSFEERQQLVDFYSNIEENRAKIRNIELLPQSKIKYKWYSSKYVVANNALRRAEYKENVVCNMLFHAKSRAKKRGLEFSLKESDIHLPKYCPIFGIELSVGKDNIETSPSLERIDSTKGYTPDNVIIVSYRANRAKGDATLEELIKINNFYKQFQTN